MDNALFSQLPTSSPSLCLTLACAVSSCHPFSLILIILIPSRYPCIYIGYSRVSALAHMDTPHDHLHPLQRRACSVNVCFPEHHAPPLICTLACCMTLRGHARTRTLGCFHHYRTLRHGLHTSITPVGALTFSVYAIRCLCAADSCKLRRD